MATRIIRTPQRRLGGPTRDPFRGDESGADQGRQSASRARNAVRLHQAWGASGECVGGSMGRADSEHAVTHAYVLLDGGRSRVWQRSTGNETVIIVPAEGRHDWHPFRRNHLPAM